MIWIEVIGSIPAEVEKISLPCMVGLPFLYKGSELSLTYTAELII